MSEQEKVSEETPVDPCYEVLQAGGRVLGEDAVTVVPRAIAELLAKVDGRIRDGWQPTGGITCFSHPRPNGVLVIVMQAMWKPPLLARRIGVSAEYVGVAAGQKPVNVPPGPVIVRPTEVQAQELLATVANNPPPPVTAEPMSSPAAPPAKPKGNRK